ncbi:MAG: hypothetical protein U0531_18755 [Dehalococcoidia bacterium]
MAADDQHTPARRQYLGLKRRHPDALLLYRMGDFYELFDDDAVVAARDLHITLTSREFGRGNRVPMAGVPHHALSTYLRRLLARGHRVAVCEQLSEPGKGLVERDVVRVLSPGTVVEPGLLAAKENTYLIALNPGRAGVGLACLDASTGEFSVTEFGLGEEAALAAELARLAPAECLVPEGRPLDGPVPACPLTVCPPRWFQEDAARDRLLRHFAAPSLEPFGYAPTCRSRPAAAAAYVEGTNPDLVRLLRDLRTYTSSAYVTPDPHTRRNLELTPRRPLRRPRLLPSSASSTIRAPPWVVGCCAAGSIARCATAAIDRRLDAVAALVSDHDRRAFVTETLATVGDLERIAGRGRQGIATPRDLLALAAGLRAAGTMADRVEDVPSLSAAIDPAPEVVDLVERAVSDEQGRLVRRGYDAELDDLTATAGNAQQTLLAMERRERERTGIRSLKIRFNKVFGYYFEVTKANLRLVPEDFIRRQTLANGEAVRHAGAERMGGAHPSRRRADQRTRAGGVRRGRSPGRRGGGSADGHGDGAGRTRCAGDVCRSGGAAPLRASRGRGRAGARHHGRASSRRRRWPWGMGHSCRTTRRWPRTARTARCCS